MNWRTHLGNLASGAQALAQSAIEQIEQGVPAAKRVAGHVRAVAVTVADEFVKVAERAQGASSSEHAAETSAPTAVPAKDPISVRNQNSAVIDLTGMPITADDARELLRRPAGLDQAVIDAVVGHAVPSAEQAEEIRGYIAGTPVTIFEVSARVEANAAALRERGHLDGCKTLWEGVRDATAILLAYDKANGTDFAASSWLSMMRVWDKSAIAQTNTAAAGAAAMAIHLASESPRAHHHVSDVCAQLLATAHVSGWPSILFDDAGGIDKLASLVRSAAAYPDLRAGAAKSAFSVTGAMMLTPVTDAEAALPRMNPSALRAEVGLAICDVLDQLGGTSHDAMRAAVHELAASPAANPGALELRELDRLPSWLVSNDLTFGNDAQRYARDTMSEAQALELAAYVADTKGDIGAIEKRLRALWIAPRVCADLAERFGVEAKPPINGLRHGSFIGDGVEVAQNLERALRMLASFDEKHGTRHGADAATALLAQTTLGPRHRDLVGAVREVFASATADDKKLFFAKVTDLIEANAWPSAARALPEMSSIIGGLAGAASASSDFATSVFVTGFKLVTTESHAPYDPNDSDQLGRSAMAGMIASLAESIGRTTDAAIYRSLEERLHNEHTGNAV